MDPRIIGTVMPVLEVTLDPGETVFAESGQLSWMTESIRLHTSTRVAAGGVFGAVKRAVAGDGLFLAALTGPGRVWLQSLTVSNLAHAITPYLPLPEPDRR
ncbi:uncharacterized protein (AIM24 family) [Nocardia sp. GAS34]|uniref:AIM24 family protein n=1 Tax=unclassified Nocardia TaxID=2637762 RepID=UPI003D26060E